MSFKDMCYAAEKTGAIPFKLTKYIWHEVKDGVWIASNHDWWDALDIETPDEAEFKSGVYARAFLVEELAELLPRVKLDLAKQGYGWDITLPRHHNEGHQFNSLEEVFLWVLMWDKGYVWDGKEFLRRSKT